MRKCRLLGVLQEPLVSMAVKMETLKGSPNFQSRSGCDDPVPLTPRGQHGRRQEAPLPALTSWAVGPEGFVSRMRFPLGSPPTRALLLGLRPQACERPRLRFWSLTSTQTAVAKSDFLVQSDRPGTRCRLAHPSTCATTGLRPPTCRRAPQRLNSDPTGHGDHPRVRPRLGPAPVFTLWAASWSFSTDCSVY